jgi:hypothetical protein
MGFHWPAARLQGVKQRRDIGGRDRELGHADRQAGRVLDPDVLDIHAGRTGRVEQAGQLARPVTDDHLDHRERALRAAVLARDPGHARLTAMQQVGDGLRLPFG